MRLKRILRKTIDYVVYRHKASSESYIKYLRRRGIYIGKDVEIFNPKNTIIDEQYPCLITIGNHVRITDGVIILTHDFSWSVIKNYSDAPGRLLGACGRVTIGDNVFIGMNSIITRNVSIGDNVIIGVGSVVTHNCESNAVYAGNPAKKIMNLNEYIEKRTAKQLEEATLLAKSYIERMKCNPPEDLFFEFFLLYSNPVNAKANKLFAKQMSVGNTLEKTIEFYSNRETLFNGYEEFLEYVKRV